MYVNVEYLMLKTRSKFLWFNFRIFGL